MKDNEFSILLFILGLVIGIVLILVINYLKNKKKEKLADSIIEKQKKKLINIRETLLLKLKKT